MRAWKLVLGLVLLVPLLSGCWDRIEVNDLAIVDMVGIDPSPQGVRLTASVIVPSWAQPTPTGGQGGAQGRAAMVYTAEGETIMDAQTRIQERISRRLFWAHTRILVIGEEYARAGVRPALDFWSRHREPRMSLRIVVTPGKAADFVAAEPRLERLLSETVRETLNQRLQVVIPLREFLICLRSDSEQPVAPRVELVTAPDTPGRSDVLVSGAAIFRDDRLIGWLNDSETRGLLWLRGEAGRGVATVQVPAGGRISMMLIRSRTSVRPDFSSGKLRLVVELIADDDVYETSASLDLGKEEVVRMAEELLRKDIEERARQTIDKVQKEYGVDVLRFGDAVRRRAPLAWEGGLKDRWAEVFPEVPVDLVVTVHVRRTGGDSAPLSIKKEQIGSKSEETQKPGEEQ